MIAWLLLHQAKRAKGSRGKTLGFCLELLLPKVSVTWPEDRLLFHTPHQTDSR